MRSKPSGQAGAGTAGRLLREGRLAEAARLYRDRLRSDPEDAGAWASLGHVLRLAGEPEAGAGACRRALALEPDSLLALTNLGAALLAAGDPQGALGAFERALALAPSDAECLANLAAARQALGEPGQAQALLERAVAAAPAHPALHRAQGWSLMTLGRWDEACSAYGTAIRLLADRPPDGEQAPQPAGGLDPEACREALLAAKRALERLGQPFFLAYGTLLGLVREQGFIAHDSDIDLGFARSADKPALAAALERAGFAYDGWEAPADAIHLPLTHTNGAILELYEHWEEGGRCVSGFALAGARLLWGFTPFGLSEADWLGVRFAIPAEPEAYLAEGYGDWRRPERHFDATFWAPNIVGGFPPLARACAYQRTADCLSEGRRERAAAHIDRILEWQAGDLGLEAARRSLLSPSGGR